MKHQMAAVARRPMAMALAALWLADAAQAQVRPDSGSQFSEQQRLQQRAPTGIPQFERDETVRPALRQPGGERILIKHIRFSGAVDLVPESELNALLADAIGQAHDFAGLEALAQKVTDHLKRAGFLLARAYLPRQDISDGNLEIAILAGRLDSKNEPVKIVPGGKLALRIDPERLRAIANVQLPAGAVANEGSLQRAALLMNDLPGITARARLEPGSEPDTTRIVFDVEEGPMLSMSVSLDNYGNRYTGEVRGVAMATLSDPFGQGDRATMQFTEARHSRQFALNYSLPLGNDGWRIGLSATQLASQTKKEFSRLDIEAESDTLGLNLGYPMVRSRLNNLWLSLAADRRRYLDTARGLTTNDRETTPISLGLQGDNLDSLFGGGFMQGSLSYVEGNLDLNLAVVRAGDAATARSAGHYDKWTWSILRLQRLDADWTLLLSANGQVAGKNLDTSEKFLLGGPAGVRAYAGGEGQGDSGQTATVELRYDIGGGTLGMWQLAGFYDAGRITLHKDAWAGLVSNATQSNTYTLQGFGFGLSLAKTGSHQLRLAVARRIGDNPGRSLAGKDSDGLAETTRAWLQGIVWF